SPNGGGSGRTYSPGGSSTGGRSYGSGGNPSRPPTNSTSPPGASYPPSANPNRPPISASPSGKSYTSSGEGNVNSGVKPNGKSYDARAAYAQKQAESRAAYRKGEEPQTRYVDPKGVTRNIDPRDAQIRQLREDLDYERWSNRSWRMRSFYGDYYWGRPV